MSLLLPYLQPLRPGVFVKRYKRFFVDVMLQNGEQEAVHCPNSGSMKSCLIPQVNAYTLDSLNPERKLRHTLELLELPDGLACLNTGRANQFVEKFLEKEVYENISLCPGKPFSKYDQINREVKYSAHTRFDFCLSQSKGDKKAWIEVKSVSLCLEPGVYSFPDAVTERGQKHLIELMDVVNSGQEAFLIFVIMRGGKVLPEIITSNFRACREIDPTYDKLLNQAVASGVKILILVPNISLEGFSFRSCALYPSTPLH